MIVTLVSNKVHRSQIGMKINLKEVNPQTPYSSRMSNNNISSLLCKIKEIIKPQYMSMSKTFMKKQREKIKILICN